jgi:hypothetical protein
MPTNRRSPAADEADRLLEETIEREFSIGLDAESAAGTGRHNDDTGPADDTVGDAADEPRTDGAGRDAR